MARRQETSLTEFIFSVIAIYYFYLWLVNKSQFWISFYIGLGLAILTLIIYVWWQLHLRKKKEEMVEATERLGLSEDVSTFINRYGKEKGKSSWKYMGYGFDIDKMRLFIKTLSCKGLGINDVDDLELVLMKYIDIREETLMKGGFESKQYKFSSLSGQEFEDLLIRLYGLMGYIVEHPGGVGDQGGDLILNKNGQRILVQAKRYSGNIGNAAVQEAVAAKKYYDCNQVMLIGSSNFTRAALDLASYNEVELIGKSELQGLLLSYLNESWD
ncbi:MAG: restriction endonuclease [Candidatus Pacebacteria bacterium]|nr:restriction endonuclease [Candidatus Paceibacterota bacterium]